MPFNATRRRPMMKREPSDRTATIAAPRPQLGNRTAAESPAAPCSDHRVAMNRAVKRWRVGDDVTNAGPSLSPAARGTSLRMRAAPTTARRPRRARGSAAAGGPPSRVRATWVASTRRPASIAHNEPNAAGGRPTDVGRDLLAAVEQERELDAAIREALSLTLTSGRVVERGWRRRAARCRAQRVERRRARPRVRSPIRPLPLALRSPRHARRREPCIAAVLGFDGLRRRTPGGEPPALAACSLVEDEALVEDPLAHALVAAVPARLGDEAMPIRACCDSPSFLLSCQRRKPSPMFQFR